MQHVKNRKLSLALSSLAVACLVAGGIYYFKLSGANRDQTNNSSENAAQESQRSSLIVDKPGRISYQGEDGRTVLDLLKQHTPTVTTETQFGEVVQSIQGVSSDRNGAYWVFYIDGALGDQAANSLKTSSKQVIEWRFEKPKNLSRD